MTRYDTNTGPKTIDIYEVDVWATSAAERHAALLHAMTAGRSQVERALLAWTLGVWEPGEGHRLRAAVEHRVRDEQETT